MNTYPFNPRDVLTTPEAVREYLKASAEWGPEDARHALGIVNGLLPAWQTKLQDELADAIAEFKASLPGWCYSVCECQVSCDAWCAPTTESPDVALVEFNNPFDNGFRAYLEQPSTLAEALRDVTRQALAAIAEDDAHASDCATNNEPALPAEDCDCRIDRGDQAKIGDRLYTALGPPYRVGDRIMVSCSFESATHMGDETVAQQDFLWGSTKGTLTKGEGV